MELNWLDLIILALICLSALLGFMRGFVGWALAIVGVLAAIVLAFLFYNTAGEFFIRHRVVADKSVATIGGFILVFLGSYVVLVIIGWVVKLIVKALSLRWLDMIAGGLAGVISGILLSAVLVWALGFVMPTDAPPFTNSFFLPHIKNAVALFRSSIPEDSKEKLKEAGESAREKGEEIKKEVEQSIKSKEGQMRKEKGVGKTAPGGGDKGKREEEAPLNPINENI